MQTPTVNAEDSPDFRQWEHEVGQTIGPLKERCLKLRQGAKDYVAALSRFADAQRDFGDRLNEFGYGLDEETEELGGQSLMTLAEGFVLHADQTDMLKTGIEVAMTNHLKEKWLRGILNDAKEAKLASEQRRAECEVLMRKQRNHQNRGTAQRVHALFTAGDSAERLQAELEAAENAAFESRCNALRTFHELQGFKRYDFLRMYVENAQNHFRHFDRQARVFKALETEIATVSGIVRACEAEHRDRTVDVEKQIDNAQTNVRSQDNSYVNESPRPGGGSDCTDTTDVSGRYTEGSTVASEVPRDVSIVKEGYLDKQSTGLHKGWQRRFFRLDSLGNFYYENTESRGPLKFALKRGGDTVMSLATANVKPGLDDPDPSKAPKYTFRVISPQYPQGRCFNLQAASEAEMNDWIRALEDMTRRLLSGPDIGRHVGIQPQASHRRQHSRGSSISTADDFTVVQPPPAPAPEQKGPRNWRNFNITLQQPANAQGGQGQHIRRASMGSFEQSNSGPVPTPTPRFQEQATSPDGGRGAGPISPQGGRHGSHSANNNMPASSSSRSSAAQDPASSVVRRLRQGAGNDRCADCGAKHPEWASLNLGVLICMDCSGAHRHLGTDISKVHSLTLDTRVWEGPALDMMAELSNDSINSVYEYDLAKPQTRGSSNGLDRNGSNQARKPDESSSLEERERFITAKYKNRAFVPPETTVVQMALLAAFRRGNLEATMQAVAKGADLHQRLSMQYSDAIMAEIDQICEPLHYEETLRVDIRNPMIENATSKEDRGIPPIMAACRAGKKSVLEFVILNGADKNCVDSEGRSLLHYAAIFGNSELVRYLIKRGVDRNLKDRDGQTAFDVAKRVDSLDPLDVRALSPEGMPRV